MTLTKDSLSAQSLNGVHTRHDHGSDWSPDHAVIITTKDDDFEHPDYDVATHPPAYSLAVEQPLTDGEDKLPGGAGDKLGRFQTGKEKTVQCCKKFAAFLFSTIGTTVVMVGYTILGGVIFNQLEAPYEVRTRSRFIVL